MYDESGDATRVFEPFTPHDVAGTNCTRKPTQSLCATCENDGSDSDEIIVLGVNPNGHELLHFQSEGVRFASATIADPPAVSESVIVVVYVGGHPVSLTVLT